MMDGRPLHNSLKSVCTVFTKLTENVRNLEKVTEVKTVQSIFSADLRGREIENGEKRQRGTVSMCWPVQQILLKGVC